MPEASAQRFPADLADGWKRMMAQGEDAMSLWPALMRAALAYPACGVPVRILGGTTDLVVDNARNGWLAAAMMPKAKFDWMQGVGHMLHHVRPDRITALASPLAQLA